jgi:hypothetical protein
MISYNEKLIDNNIDLEKKNQELKDELKACQLKSIKLEDES